MGRQSSQAQPRTDAAPLNEFSQCHVGILSHLEQFGRLPALVEPAAQARRIAHETLSFFRDVIYEHHAAEERELFPAVLASAARGDEHKRVKEVVERLTREHRRIESAWERVQPELKAIATGRDTALNSATVQRLVREYRAHASFEESEFLPLSQAILGRDDRHLAALGLSLHMRHALPEAMKRFRGRI